MNNNIRLRLFLSTLMALVLLCLCPQSSVALSITDFSADELLLLQENDQEAVLIFRNGLINILLYMKSRPDIFPPHKLSSPKLPNQKQREDIKSIWKSLLDYYLALDSIGTFHNDFFMVNNIDAQRKSFFIANATIFSEYRIALDFISLCENNPALDTLLNEAVPSLGLPAKMYSKFKFRFLNIYKAGEFAAYETIRLTWKGHADSQLIKIINEDRELIWGAATNKGPAMTFLNGIDLLKKSAHKIWFPVQKGVSTWMGNTKVLRKGEYLINQDQIKNLKSQLEPGDILLERREWFMTNVGIPGFWTHAALYIGTADDRLIYFNDSKTLDWVKKKGAEDFDDLLQKTWPDAYAASVRKTDKGYKLSVIEAIARGVVFTSLEYSAHCDSLAVLRPQLTKKEKAVAIFRALKYSNRPYDYNFDFLTDNALVCTELVYKAYEPGTESNGLKLPLENRLGHILIPANSFAHLYTEEYNNPNPQLRLVTFLDGVEKEKKIIISTAEAFRESWKRPKWHILIQQEFED